MTEATSKAKTAEAIALIEAIRPILAGKGPDIQSAVLGELFATWVVGHHPSIRGQAVTLWFAYVEGLIVENDRHHPNRWDCKSST